MRPSKVLPSIMPATSTSTASMSAIRQVGCSSGASSHRPRALAPDALAGHYGGVTASATVAVGVGANVLVGGFNKSITLQPVSIEGNTGLNVAAGIAEITLRPEH